MLKWQCMHLSPGSLSPPPPPPSSTGPHQAATSQEARITVRGGPAEGYFLILGYPWILMYTYFLYPADINLITTQSSNEEWGRIKPPGRQPKGMCTVILKLSVLTKFGAPEVLTLSNKKGFLNGTHYPYGWILLWDNVMCMTYPLHPCWSDMVVSWLWAY